MRKFEAESAKATACPTPPDCASPVAMAVSRRVARRGNPTMVTAMGRVANSVVSAMIRSSTGALGRLVMIRTGSFSCLRSRDTHNSGRLNGSVWTANSLAMSHVGSISGASRVASRTGACPSATDCGIALPSSLNVLAGLVARWNPYCHDSRYVWQIDGAAPDCHNTQIGVAVNWSWDQMGTVRTYRRTAVLTGLPHEIEQPQ